MVVAKAKPSSTAGTANAQTTGASGIAANPRPKITNPTRITRTSPKIPARRPRLAEVIAVEIDNPAISRPMPSGVEPNRPDIRNGRKLM